MGAFVLEADRYYGLPRDHDSPHSSFLDQVMDMSHRAGQNFSNLFDAQNRAVFKIVAGAY